VGQHVAELRRPLQLAAANRRLSPNGPERSREERVLNLFQQAS
jgi:hypothetical protein